MNRWLTRYRHGGYASLYPPYVDFAASVVCIKAQRAESTGSRPARITAAVVLFAFAMFADAATNIYGIRGNAVAGVHDIIHVDPVTGAATTVYDDYPGGNAATIGQCPNGLLYYAINGAPNQLYVFNPQTPAVAPAALGTGLADGALKMACSPGGVLYYLTEALTSNLHINQYDDRRLYRNGSHNHQYGRRGRYRLQLRRHAFYLQ